MTQQFPSRINPADIAVLGSTTGADTNDPLYLAHTGEHYVFLSGVAGNHFTTPSTAALQITGDIDLRAEAALDNWASSVQTLVAKYGTTGNQRSYWLRVAASGVLELVFSSDGTNPIFAVSTVATGFAAGTRRWVRATLDVDDGAGNRVVQFFTSTDGVTWTQLGTTVTTAGTTSIFAGTSSLSVGATVESESNRLTGNVYAAEVRNGINGTVVASFNPNRDINTAGNPDAGQTSWVSATGETWTVNRSATGRKTAVVTRSVWQFDGSDDYIQLPAADTPTFTATTGKHTVIVAGRFHAAGTAFHRIWSSESATNVGAHLTLWGSGSREIRSVTGGSTSLSRALGTYTDSAMWVVAFVQDDGNVRGYLNGTLSANTSTTGVGTVTHGTPRVGSQANAVGSVIRGSEIFLVRSLPGVALTATELAAIESTIRRGYA
jgi:hypothetical protein